MKECCNNCRYQSELILWERDKENRYLPNYDHKLTCCIAFTLESRVYGHTEEHNGQCEMFSPKKSARKDCSTCKHEDEEWYSESCDGCISAYDDKPSNYEPNCYLCRWWNYQHGCQSKSGCNFESLADYPWR